MTASKPSKSARKRENLERQKLGERLIALNDSELAALPLDDELRSAIHAAARISSRGALRRQKQLIGRLMRQVDPLPIQNALAALGADDRATKRLFASAERWRDRIVADGGPAVAALEATVGERDDELRSLFHDLQTAPHEPAERAVRRRIFRHVHALLAALEEPETHQCGDSS